MKRRDFVERSAAFGLLSMLSACTGQHASADAAANQPNPNNSPKPATSADNQAITNPLTPPAKGTIPVAFVISEGTVMIDLAGPWEVFNDVMIPARGSSMEEQMPFRTYTVAETLKPVSFSGGLKVVPNYTLANAPAPKVVVIPAQSDGSTVMLDWIRNATKATDVTMSVCTGAFILAKTGLLSGKAATTHHDAYTSFAMKFPDITLQRGARFVEAGNLASSGGLSSGIDLALRVVERYFGRKTAADTAYDMEYQGQGWRDANSNAMYAKAEVSTDDRQHCPVCGMSVDRATAPHSAYKGKPYYFCSQAHKAEFDAAPEKWQ
jgi:putative intracellular protease/amidase/YHS domain-containing protein